MYREESFSPAGLRAFVGAQYLARERCAAEVEPIDLFESLLGMGESQATALLRRAGGDVDALLGLVDPLDLTFEQFEDPLPLSAAAAEVLRHANELAGDQARFDQLGSEELFAALCAAWPGADERVRAAGVDALKVLGAYTSLRTSEPIHVAPAEQPIIEDFAERMDLARIIDANANRLREALRVVEDYARFVLDDPMLMKRIKRCRHRVRQALEFLPGDWILAARETRRDVGTAVAAPDEYARANLRIVLVANLKRAQESARALEEYAKVESMVAAKELEQTRYELYTIERSLRIGSRARRRLEGMVLYWLVDPEACRHSLEWTVREAIAGGVQVVQLRDKTSRDRALLETARQLREWTSELGALFIINDRPDIARLVGADGVHVGQEEFTVRDVRRLVGPEVLVGVSTHTIEQAREAVLEGADYLGVGPVFFSQTKAFDEFAGLPYVKAAASEIRLPFFAIGGVRLENLDAVIEAGARRIAVGQAITDAIEPRDVAHSFRAALEPEPAEQAE